VAFYELIAIEREGEGLVMRIKHFNAGLKGWEEKDDCAELDLVEFKGKWAVWSRRGDEAKWLLYEQIGDRQQAWFEKLSEPSPTDESRFSFLRLS